MPEPGGRRLRLCRARCEGLFRVRAGIERAGASPLHADGAQTASPVAGIPETMVPLPSIRVDDGTALFTPVPRFPVARYADLLELGTFHTMGLTAFGAAAAIQLFSGDGQMTAPAPELARGRPGDEGQVKMPAGIHADCTLRPFPLAAAALVLAAESLADQATDACQDAEEYEFRENLFHVRLRKDLVMRKANPRDRFSQARRSGPGFQAVP